MLAEEELGSAGIGTARLDALVLLEHVLKTDRAKLLAEPNTEISTGQIAKLAKLLTKRAQHVPIAYLLGYTEFYGRRFIVGPEVLEPRPESETMIDLLKDLAQSSPNELKSKQTIKLADVGAGSGALGITAMLEVPNLKVELLEIDQKALKIAQMNVDKYTMGVKALRSDLLSGSRQQNDILLCNLPYVPDSYHINEAAAMEPRIAIFGGADGLDLYRKLFNQLSKLQKGPLFLLTECLPSQQPALTAIAPTFGYNVVKNEDFILVFKRT